MRAGRYDPPDQATTRVHGFLENVKRDAELGPVVRDKWAFVEMYLASNGCAEIAHLLDRISELWEKVPKESSK